MVPDVRRHKRHNPTSHSVDRPAPIKKGPAGLESYGNPYRAGCGMWGSLFLWCVGGGASPTMLGGFIKKKRPWAIPRLGLSIFLHVDSILRHSVLRPAVVMMPV